MVDPRRIPECISSIAALRGPIRIERPAALPGRCGGGGGVDIQPTLYILRPAHMGTVSIVEGGGDRVSWCSFKIKALIQERRSNTDTRSQEVEFFFIIVFVITTATQTSPSSPLTQRCSVTMAISWVARGQGSAVSPAACPALGHGSGCPCGAGGAHPSVLGCGGAAAAAGWAPRGPGDGAR